LFGRLTPPKSPVMIKFMRSQQLVVTFSVLVLIAVLAGCAVPPAAPASTPPQPTSASDIQITELFHEGQVSGVESDEYVEITNLGNDAVDITGWILRDIDGGYPDFVFPAHTLQSGHSVRVYTNEIHPESGGFSFRYGQAIWSNSNPDTAGLFDASGTLVSTRSY
jgi:hypothetical protein